MKKVFFFLLILATGFVSCNKQPVQEPGSGKKVEVTVEIKGTLPLASNETKSTGNIGSNEAKVNNLQVFAFNNGNLEDYSSVNNTFTAVLNATTGSREIWAIANAPNLSSVTTLTELKARTSMLADNSLNNFVMVGSTTHVLSSANDANNPIAITVKRIVSRVSLAKISADFKLTMSDARFRVDNIYLINVVGSQLYSIDGTNSWVINPTTWLNQLVYTASGADALIYDVVSSGVTSVFVRNGNAYNVQHDFYPYPNALGQARTIGGPDEHSPMAHGTNVYSDTWSPRQTMLVIKGQFFENAGDNTGFTGYYAIDLPALERNKTYIIEDVLLTRRPSDPDKGEDPWEPIDTGQSYVTISVHDWETGLSLGQIVC